MAMKGLESTYIYSHLNRTNGLSNNIMNILNNGSTLTKEQLEESLMIINKNFKFPLKHEVIKDFTEGGIILKHCAAASMPTCMPFFLTKIQGRVVAIVVADLYGTYDKDTNNFKIDPKKLYCMMESAYLAKLIYFNSERISSTSSIYAQGSEIYSSVFTRVLNKKYALNVDKSKMHKVLMLSSKFFMINVMGVSDSDMVFNYAIKNCPNGNVFILKETNGAVNPDAYTSFDKFINELATNTSLGLNFKDLSVRGYLESFINMYDSSALLSLESFPYFMYMVDCVVNGAYINNQYVLEDLVGTTGSKMYTSLTKFVNR